MAREGGALVRREIKIKVRGTWHTVGLEDPQRYPFEVTVDGEPMDVEVDTGPKQASLIPPEPPGVESPRSAGFATMGQNDQKIIRSPIPGRIVSVSVGVWDDIASGEELCILETMKMEQSITVSNTGIVRAVFIQGGQNIATGDPMIQLE